MVGSFLIAAAAATIMPSGPWNVESQESVCLLSRQYGAEKKKLILGFQPLFAQRRMEVVILSSSKVYPKMIDAANISRDFDGKVFPVDYSSVTMPGGYRITRLTTDRDIFDQLDKTKELSIKTPSVQATFAIVNFAKAAPYFRTCQENLLKKWGIESASLTAGRWATPIGDVSKYFTRKDYPKTARHTNQEGLVTVLLNIDKTGRAEKCRTVAGADQALNDATCAGALKISFNAGKDANGQPAPSIFVMSVRWQISFE